MKVLTAMPEELIVRAKQVLAYEEIAKRVIATLTMEIVKNHQEVIRLWNDVKAEVERQGIGLGKDETLNYDYIVDKFTIIKRE